MNDRCDETSNDRNNDNRLYNSNDNAAGGYAWCDQEMVFYEGTSIHIEWMSQHSCGNGASNKDDPTNPESTICQEILQLGCEPTFKMFAWGAFQPEYDNYQFTHGESLGRPCTDAQSLLQNPSCTSDPTNSQAAFNVYGNTCTQTRPLLSSECPGGTFNDSATCDALNLATSTSTFNSATCQCSTRKAVTYGYMEPENWYLQCQARARNGGLFTADQNPNPNNGAQNTRQEPNSARYGYECTEERDYYPYFHPTPWIDLAIFTSQANANCSYYMSQSQNTNNKCLCTAAPSDNGTWTTCMSDITQNTLCPWYYNNQRDCEVAGFDWSCFGAWNWAEPTCQTAFASTDNRLGNLNLRGDTADSAQTNANLAYYDWNIPNGAVSTIYTSVNNYLNSVGLAPITTSDTVRCTIRLRYNISNYDVPWDFDYTDNSRIYTNPVQQYGWAIPSYVPTAAPTVPSNTTTESIDNPANSVPVRMAINTAQYGRVFQDRTYVFQIKQRSALPTQVPTSATIWNINVRGKRGNIAQVRNCVEYDYVPNVLSATVGDWVLFQWCGSDYNDPNNSGEGRDGTDRNNVVAVISGDYGRNLPLNATNTNNTLLFSTTDLLALAWIGQNPNQCYNTQQSLTTYKASNEDPMSCHFLNGPRIPGVPYMPTAYFYYFAQIINGGTINFMNSRNNNFSNRSQKATISASGGVSVAVIVSATVCSVVGVALIAGLAWGFYTKKLAFGKFSSRV